MREDILLERKTAIGAEIESLYYALQPYGDIDSTTATKLTKHKLYCFSNVSDLGIVLLISRLVQLAQKLSVIPHDSISSGSASLCDTETTSDIYSKTRYMSSCYHSFSHPTFIWSALSRISCFVPA